MLHTLRLLTLALLLGLLAGCSWQQAYSGAQMWQKQECNKLQDALERSRCMERTQDSHDHYQRQTQGVSP